MKSLRLISFLLALSTTTLAQEKSFSDYIYSSVDRFVASVSQLLMPSADPYDTDHRLQKKQEPLSTMEPSYAKGIHTLTQTQGEWRTDLYRLYYHVARLHLEQQDLMPDALKNEAEDPEFFPPVAQRDLGYITHALQALKGLNFSEKSLPKAQEVVRQLYEDLDEGELSEQSAETLLNLNVPVPEEVLVQYRSQYGWIRTIGLGLTVMLASQYAVGVAAECMLPQPSMYHSDQGPDRGMMQVCEDSLFECWTRHAPVEDTQSHGVSLQDIEALYDLPSYRNTVECLQTPGFPSETCMGFVQESVNGGLHSDIITYHFSNATDFSGGSVYGHPYIMRTHYDVTAHEFEAPSGSYGTEWAPYPALRFCNFFNQGSIHRSSAGCDQACGERNFSVIQPSDTYHDPFPYLSLLMNFQDYVKVVSVYNAEETFGLSTFLLDREGETQVLWEGVVTDQTYTRVPSISPRDDAHIVSPPEGSFAECSDYTCLLKSYYPDSHLISAFDLENDPIYEAASMLLPIETMAVSALAHLGNFTQAQEGQFLRLGEIDARQSPNITYTIYVPGKGPATRYNTGGNFANPSGPLRDAHTAAHYCTFYPGTGGDHYKTCEVNNAFEGILDTQTELISQSVFEQAHRYVQPGQYLRYFELRNHNKTLGTFLDMSDGGRIVHQGVWPVEGRGTKPSEATKYDQASYTTFQNLHALSARVVACDDPACGIRLQDWAQDYASRTLWVQTIVSCLTTAPDPDVCFSHLFDTLDYARLRRFTPIDDTLSVQVHDSQGTPVQTYSLLGTLPHSQKAVYQLEYYPWAPQSASALLVQVGQQESGPSVVSYSGILPQSFLCSSRLERPDCPQSQGRALTETQEQYDIGTATYYSGDVEMPRLRHIQSDSLRIQDSKPLSLGFDTFLQKWPHVLDRLVRDGVVPQAERYTVSIQPPSRVSIHGVLQIFCFERQEGAESWQVLDMMIRHKGLNRNGAQEKIKIEPGYSGPCERFEEYHAS